ncbi:Uncharacterised protein [Bordetella pertussis]|nr:Uncharacterised protein [Bordetella pertussis]
MSTWPPSRRRPRPSCRRPSSGCASATRASRSRSRSWPTSPSSTACRAARPISAWCTTSPRRCPRSMKTWACSMWCAWRRPATAMPACRTSPRTT